MGKYLIVSRVDNLMQHKELSSKYDIAFEINDFTKASVLDDSTLCNKIINEYNKVGVPAQSTMHGAFYDIILFSCDDKIRELAIKRMRQSLDIARRLKVSSVVFHTNHNPLLSSKSYDNAVINGMCQGLSALLTEYSDVNIYLENMFDNEPVILEKIAENLKKYENFGICLDWAHAIIFGGSIEKWIKSLAPYVKHLHINDNNLTKDQHLAVGSGQINWNEYAKYYNRFFKNCSVLIETNEPKDQESSILYLSKLMNPNDYDLLGGLEVEEQMLEGIFGCMNKIINEKDFNRAIVLLTELGKILVDADRTSFWYWDKDKKQYWTIAASGINKITIPEGSGIVGAAISENKIILLNDPYSDARFNPSVDKDTGYLTKSIICMPVVSDSGEVIGAYQAINKLTNSGRFSEQDTNRLALAAVFCGKTLENQLLRGQSQKDALTGLKNRRGFYEYYENYAFSKTSQLETGVIMCDIDFFKKVNDTYGHNAGDEVLKVVASTINSCVRSSDGVFRWGGEEFVLLLPGAGIDKTIALAEKIRTTIEAATIEFEEYKIKVTMSFGVDILLKECQAEDNVKRADDKLYIAKKTGRNKVVGMEESV